MPIHRILSKLLINDLYLKPKKGVCEQKSVEFWEWEKNFFFLQNGTIHMDSSKNAGMLIVCWMRLCVEHFHGRLGCYAWL